MKGIFFLVVIAAPLIALAESGGSPFAELVRRLPGQNLHARSGIDPSTVSKECQSTCTPIIKTLDACNSVASCECTQANYDALGTCLNCLQALAAGSESLGFTPGADLGQEFGDACTQDFGYQLNGITVTAKPTGIASTGDPFSIFDAPTPTPGATQAIAFQSIPLFPTQDSQNAGPVPPGVKTGSAVGLSAPQSLGTGAVVAVVAVAIFMGRIPL
ncbi:hypothetical protein H4582DRAFT_2075881 [Lactarius indigo]|nr:hypothetical protein H4582DRAFT_2075881 [Lactarius indigo]